MPIIHLVSDFEHNPIGILEELKGFDGPAILTSDGKAEFVVQSVDSYLALLEKVADAEDLEAIREGLAQSLAGDGQPAEDFFRTLRDSTGL